MDQLFTQGKVLRSHPRFDVTQVASSYRSASACLRSSSPDVVVTDVRFADGCGIDIIRECTSRHPRCSVMVLSSSRDESSVFGSLTAGASGYILRDGSENSIDEAILELHSGGSPLSPQIARMVLKRLHAGRPPSPVRRHPPSLTRREVDVLAMIDDGHGDKAIGEALSISCLTVQTHTKNIYRKLGVRSRMEALSLIRRQGYLLS